MNLSIIIGNLGSDAEVKESNGSKFITFSVADSRKIKKQDGSSIDVTNWVDCVISNVEHPVLPWLKAGTKVCVIGNSSLRVFSSKKDRMMKAGQTIHVVSIELCGGASDEVPKQLIVPDTGALVDVSKHYWCTYDTKHLKKDEYDVLVDSRGREYMVNKAGFVQPISVSPASDDGEGQNAHEENA